MSLSGKWNGTDILSIPGHLAHAPGVFTNLSSVNRQDRDYMLENYHKMIIVRNPFERLLSAYRNKLEGETPTAKYFQVSQGYQSTCPSPRLTKSYQPFSYTLFKSYKKKTMINISWRIVYIGLSLPDEVLTLKLQISIFKKR